MSDAKSEIREAVEEHMRSLHADLHKLHDRLAAMPGVDKEKLSHAVAKLKSAHAAFADDAQACVGM
jgi:hypothetical protein